MDIGEHHQFWGGGKREEKLTKATVEKKRTEQLTNIQTQTTPTPSHPHTQTHIPGVPNSRQGDAVADPVVAPADVAVVPANKTSFSLPLASFSNGLFAGLAAPLVYMSALKGSSLAKFCANLEYCACNRCAYNYIKEHFAKKYLKWLGCLVGENE